MITCNCNITQQKVASNYLISNKRENKKNFLHLIDMAKNKTVLQTLGFTYGESEITFASQCIFTTLPLGEEAMEIIIIIIRTLFIEGDT